MHPIFNYGTFHPKLILLKFPKKLRVVITSANLRTQDWLYMGQVIWFQDFPLIACEEAIKQKRKAEFEEYLEWFLATLRPYGCKMTQLEFLNQINLPHYDFSEAAVKLIASISGRFTDKVERYGLVRLRSIIDEARRKRESTKKKQNGRQTITFFNRIMPQERPHLIYQASSIGSVNQKWLSSFYSSFTLTPAPDQPASKVSLLYPTFKQVQNCNLGLDMGGYLFLRKKTFIAQKEIFSKILSKIEHPDSDYDNNLYHTKLAICARKSSTKERESLQIQDDTAIYLGSHNLSQAAWGNLEKGGTQISMNNYELGVIFPPLTGSAEMKKRIIETLPVKLPPSKYLKDEVPFMQEDLQPSQ